MTHVGAMRKLTSHTALRAIAQVGGINEDLVVLWPWWQQTRVVVMTLLPGGDQPALQRMVRGRTGGTHTCGAGSLVFSVTTNMPSAHLYEYQAVCVRDSLLVVSRSFASWEEGANRVLCGVNVK